MLRWDGQAAEEAILEHQNIRGEVVPSLGLGTYRLTGQTLVVRKTSSRLTPESSIPRPTSASLPYIWAVSMCR